MAYVDQFSAESLLVIKQPPLSSPTIVNKKISGENNFLEDRFVCFGYRYQYQSGEFSAVSQFSDPAFTPGPFSFAPSSFLNEGMLNAYNAVEITVNTGGSLVTAFEVLFKEMDNPTIKIIEKIDKAEQGLGDDNDFVFMFDKQKIFTILPESEILRLYDNVPLKAQAQTLMGNRLVYGNYLEGGDLVDRFNNPVKFTYNTTLNTEDISLTTIPTTTGDGVYSIDGSETIADSVVSLSLGGLALDEGSNISWDIMIAHSTFTGTAPFPTETTTTTTLHFSYTLPQKFDSVYDLATSSDFVAKIGAVSGIEPVSTACDGSTFTDDQNCLLPNNLNAFVKTGSGITGSGEAIEILTFANSSSIGLQLLAMNYVSGLQNVYEYYTIVSHFAEYSSSTNNLSLHSNRGYEIGIVYMDQYNRASTALVSPDNTIHVPCENSNLLNTIRVTIPGGQAGGSPAQIAPYWATRYKFVIKPDKTTYDTIYANIFYEADDSNEVYFLLEGENANKIESGDRLIVKADATGPRSSCTYTTVLEKKSQAKDFISVDDPLNPGTSLSISAGVYMKINPHNFTVVQDLTAGGNIVQYGQVGSTECKAFPNPSGYPAVFYPVSVINPASVLPPTKYMDYTLPEGSRVKFSIKQSRYGRNGPCEKRTNTINIEVIATANYSNFKAFFDGEGVGGLFETAAVSQPVTGAVVVNTYNNTLLTKAGTPTVSDLSTSVSTNYYQFIENTSNGCTYLSVTGTASCGGGKRGCSKAEVNIEVIRAESMVVFETLPADALPDIWYENDLSFAIDGLGQHQGNVEYLLWGRSTQNQIIDFKNSGTVTAQDALIDTGFYNCFAFGNGAESYKIRDSITGKTLNFGNRTTTTSSQIYKQAHRFADLTYSGVYNDESNVNKLNEFNLGLVNYQPLEDSFGAVQKLYSRRTDILVLQEDRISYVLAGKDLLTDASGGGALTSVPKVLGTQIARSEEYGISNNPESFVSWGLDHYFTDAKRAAVIKLRGTAGTNDQLEVISQTGMRSWFRDFFINSLNSQKLGGFDPYMNEYVLSSNSQLKTSPRACLACNVSEDIQLSADEAASYCVNVGADIGTVTITYTIPGDAGAPIITEVDTPSVGTGLQDIVTELNDLPMGTEAASAGPGYTLKAYYNGVEYTTGLVYESGTLTVPKELVNITQITMLITTTSTAPDTIEVNVGCPEQNMITIYNIAITSNNEATETIHNEYRWTDGVFSSPIHSNLVTFSSSQSTPIVSQYETISGPKGAGVVPDTGATVSIMSEKKSTDNFVFDTTRNEFLYLRSATVYANTSTDIASLLAASSTASPVVTSGTTNYADFTMPSGTSSENNLYLIWDYRKSTVVTLCEDTTAFTACCNCTLAPSQPCGVTASFSGTASYPYSSTVTLGATTGTVTLTYERTLQPSRFIVEFDGAVVIDTQYIGDLTELSNLQNTLIGNNPATGSTFVDPVSGNPYGTGAGSQAIPTVNNGGFVAGTSGTATFTKSTATTTCTLKVYSPISSSNWNAKTSCVT